MWTSQLSANINNNPGFRLLLLFSQEAREHRNEGEVGGDTVEAFYQEK